MKTRCFFPPGRVLWGLLMLLPMAGCFYLPPITHTASREEVRSIQPGVDTRASVRDKLGKPNVLELASVYVWDWQVNRRTLVAGFYPAFAWGFGGDSFRVLVRFDGDRVSAIEHAELPHDPPPSGSANPPQPPPAPAPDPQAPFACVERGSRRFELDRQGNLWVLTKPDGARRLAMATSGPPAKREEPCQALAVDPEGRLAVVLRNGEARIWDAGTDGIVKVLPRPAVRAGMLVHGKAAFLCGGKLLLLSDLYGAVRMFEVGSWRLLWTWDRWFWEPPIPAPDDSRLLLVDGNLVILDVESGRPTGLIESRDLERWLDTGLEWLAFDVAFVTPDLFRARGPSTDEIWSVREIERRYRETGQPARIRKDAIEPALVAVQLRPYRNQEAR